MKDITAERIQSIVTKWKARKNPKTVKNRVATLRVVWNSAGAWKYVSHDPFEGLSLADWDKEDPPFFSTGDVNGSSRLQSRLTMFYFGLCGKPEYEETRFAPST